jgi:sigma-B regulation protein RsbU (phosphoserine phosphatase)
MLPGSHYPEHRITLRAGDRLVLFTDGITEAFDVENRAYGEAALVEVIARAGAGSAADLVAAIFDSVAAFAGAAKQSDDITLSVLECNAVENA